MIEYYKKLVRKKELKKLKDYKEDCWVNVIDPTEEEIKYLVDQFNIDKDLLIDGLDLYEVPRIEEENKKAYIFLRIPTSRIANEYTVSFLVIISNSLFITVSNSKIELFEKIIRTKKDFLTNQRVRSLLQILLFLSNRYNLRTRLILKDVKKNRRNIKNLSEKDILDLVLKEDVLNEYQSSFNALINLHAMILRLKSIKFTEEEKEIIEDLIVDLNQTQISSKIALRTITNMRDYYSTTLTNNLNKTLRILTVFTVFLSIPTLIASIYGMNIILPFQGFSLILFILFGIVILIWGIVFILFRKFNVL